MKTLLVMRHAKSSWADDNLPDHDRPLNARGKRAGPRMGELLREHGLVPDRLICSTALRARQTARSVAEASGFSGVIEERAELYLAAPEIYVAVIRKLEAKASIGLVIGHNPGVEELVFGLSGEQQAMPTGAIAQLELAIDDWSELALEPRARLVRVWRPKELD
jgi:phosphohistidine phosphatase